MSAFRFVLCAFFSFLAVTSIAAAETVNVGSKAFTEGYLLGELAAQTLEPVSSLEVSRKFGLGSTGVVVQALITGEIDVYPEYTGTISESVLHDLKVRDFSDIESKLKEQGLVMSQPLGFQNTYGLAVRRAFAEKNGLKKISDLKKVEEKIRAAFSPEFISRDDCLKSIERVYRLNFREDLQAIDHMLSYETIAENKADMIAVYSTDYQIEALDLVLLEDDRKVFPPYEAVFLASQKFVDRFPEAWAALSGLRGTIDEPQMRKLNGAVEREHESPSDVISAYRGKIREVPASSSWVAEVKRRTTEHLFLVGVAVLISIVVGIPLGFLCHRSRVLGRVLLLSTSVVQTIPSLALLCLLIPVFGIGRLPALVALCLYSLLPVVQNTLIGFQSIDPRLIETAHALGLSEVKRLLWIEFPLASRTIIAGVRTAAIIGVGTATIAALIGAGGYGAPIVSGLATNNVNLILIGAIPSALMSLAVFGLFEILNRVLIPRGLR